MHMRICVNRLAALYTSCSTHAPHSQSAREIDRAYSAAPKQEVARIDKSYVCNVQRTIVLMHTLLCLRDSRRSSAFLALLVAIASLSAMPCSSRLDTVSCSADC
jgi:hypothetical protein